MTVDIEIRAAEPADVPFILEIEGQAFSEPWSDETFRSLVGRADTELLVAEEDGSVIGYVVLWATLDEGELANVAVAESHRRRGVGAGLIEAALLAAAHRGVRRVFLEVRESNAGAARLYEGFGFFEVGFRRRYYSKPVEDARVFAKNLDA